VTLDLNLSTAADFATALLLGALLGTEREKRKQDEGSGSAGLRTFVMLTQLGAIGGYLGKELALPWLLPAVLIAAAALVLAGYFAEVRHHPESTGLTTELAALVACLLGAMTTTGHRELAVGLGVLTAALLAYKQPLHALVDRLGKDDVRVGVRLLLATFIVLPLLPNATIDPWQAINPYKLWLLVLLISGLSLVGYVAQRRLGPGRGIAVTAATGGLVSSTATTLSLTKQSRDNEGLARQYAGGILLAWAIMFARVVVTATVVDPSLLPAMLPTFAPMTLVCAGCAFVALRGGKDGAGATEVPVKNPFSLRAAAKFALLFAVVQLLVKFTQQNLPPNAVYVVAAIAGLTDVDAITLAMAEGDHGAPEGAHGAVIAIAIACFSNTAVKAGIAASMGRGLARTVVPAAGLITAAGLAGLLFGSALLG
jgi:uncharacterized membrane protein (DUF4010 family)